MTIPVVATALPACPICARPDPRVLPEHHLWDDREWQRVRCAGCGHRYTTSLPSADDLARMYDDGYFSGDGQWVCGFWAGGYLENESELRREARDALGLLGHRGGRLLEVGCAGGYFLDEARRAGFEVEGIELNASMATHARDRLGLAVHSAPFEDVRLTPQHYDVIIAQDVLEHVADPRRFVAHAARALAPGGELVIRGPLEDTTRAAVYHRLREWGNRGPRCIAEAPFHLHGFTPTSFRLLMQTAGLYPTMFAAASTLPRLSWRSPKEVMASCIAIGGVAADRVRRSGDFMAARAAKTISLAS